MEKYLKYLIWAGLIGICFIPLIVDGNYFFPFIVPKTLFFKIAAEIIFLAYLGLAVINKDYRPKLNLVLLLFFLYILTVTISSLLANSFYFSFWSNNERSEGILLLLHLFLYLFVLSGFLRRFKDWLVIFEVSFLSSILVSFTALAQYFDLSWIIKSSAGVRLTATIGNAGYVAGYLIFNIFFGLLLFFFRKNRYLRWYYSLGILLQIFVVFNTLTRGGIIALALSLFLFILYLAFVRFRKNKLVKGTSVAVLLLGIMATIFIFTNKEADWVVHNPILGRIADISLESTTAQNRLMTWQSAYQGFKEKPILGYGYENFYQVFDKYFNPKIYRKAGSVVWFDRAHNIIFDRLISGGLIGLFLYLSLLIVPLVYLWRKRSYQKQETNAYLIPVIFTLVMLAYFIQNLFIFEALVTYIPLFIVLAFLSQFCPDWFRGFSQSKKPYLSLLTIAIILFLPTVFAFNIKPALANRDFIKGLVKANSKEYKEACEELINVIERGTHGTQEYRQHLGEIVAGAVEVKQIDQNWLTQSIIRVEQEFEKQIEEKPLNTRNYMMFMRFLNKTYMFNIDRLNRALELGDKAAELSPTRPHIYQEMAYSKVYLGKYYQSLGQDKKAEQAFEEALSYMQKTIDLQDQVVESYLNMVMILFVIERPDQIQLYLDTMDEMELNYHTKEKLSRMANSAIHAQEYGWTKKFYEEVVELDPTVPENWVNLALSYAYLGEREKAIEIAKQVARFGGEYAKQSELFIQDVLNGVYDNQ